MRFTLFCLLLACCLAAPTPLTAQTVRSVEIRVDNDALNFWVPVRERPDEEYTHGMSLGIELEGAPSWARRIVDRRIRCASSSDAACMRVNLVLGQQIYTPRVDSPFTVPGDRQYAGWLFVEGTVTRAEPNDLHSLSLQLGVTGRPSLAGWAQTKLHKLGGFWEPEGWDDQLPAEPGAILGYTRSHLVGALDTGGTGILDFVPYWKVQAGNIRTDASVGARARIGFGLDHPWRAASTRTPHKYSLFASAGLHQRVALRDIFLDGTTFKTSHSVEKRPFVSSFDVGFGVRARRLQLEYRVTSRSREYRTEPGGHTYSSIILQLR
jgi:lipid A 3-O-deacylase